MAHNERMVVNKYGRMWKQ